MLVGLDENATIATLKPRAYSTWPHIWANWWRGRPPRQERKSLRQIWTIRPVVQIENMPDESRIQYHLLGSWLRDEEISLRTRPIDGR